MAYNVNRDANNNLFGCINCIVTGGAKNNALINCVNVSAIACSGIVAINCSAIAFTPNDNGFTYNLNNRILRNDWGSINSTTGSALAPYTFGDKTTNRYYEVDTSGGNVYVSFDVAKLDGEAITLKVIDATNNIIVTTVSGSGTLDGAAVPQTIITTLYDSYTIGVNGTKLYLV